MAKLSEHQSGRFTKLMYIGDSGTGKTGSLTSLVAAGYKLRVLDMDNGLDSLVGFIKRECPDKLDNVDFETRRDKFKSTTQGIILDGPPKAFVEAAKLMTTWSDGSKPEEWGSDTIFVVDSLTAMGKAAFEWAKGMNPTSRDPRQWYGAAQGALENFIAGLTGDNFGTNLIIISHINVREMQDGTMKGFPTTIGNALSYTISRSFNTLVLAESRGSGENVKRVIKTVPTGLVDLKNPAPFDVPKELPLGTGLATLFDILKGKKNA